MAGKDDRRPMPTIREARPDDADCLAVLKRRTFRETFVDGGLRIPYTAENIAEFERNSYSADSVKRELKDPAHRQWVAQEEQGDLIAYAHAGPCKLPHVDARPGHGELYQLYIADEWQGLGLGKALLEIALSWLGRNRPGPVWLGVYSGNIRAQAVYVAQGFVKVGEYDFMVGDHRDREFILRKG